MTATIDAALRDPALLGAALGDPATWRAWLTVLAAAFGVPIDDEEIVEFVKLASRKPPAERVRELWVIAGRRSGKSRIAAAVVVYIAMFVPHRLAPGEVGHVLCLSASKSQAELIHSYARAFIEASPVLRDQVANETAEEIQLRSGIVLGIHSANFRTIRGRTILAAIFDEVAFWRDESSATPDIETYRAVKPSLDASGGMLIGISSPYRTTGLLAARHRDHYGKDESNVLVIQSDSRTLNPTIAEGVVVQAYADDAASALSEWMGEFRSDLSSLFADDVIEKAIDYDRPLELAPRSAIKYHGFIDASAGRHDSFCIAIGHVKGEDDDNKRFVCDVLRAHVPPFDPNEVAREYADLADRYRIRELQGDSFAGEWVRRAFLDAGIGYEKSELTKSALALEALSSFNRGIVKLPHDEKLIRELRLLERQTHRSRKDSVDHPQGGSDDRANVIFGAMWLCGIAGTSRRGFQSWGIMSGFASGRITWAHETADRHPLKAGLDRQRPSNAKFLRC